MVYIRTWINSGIMKYLLIFIWIISCTQPKYIEPDYIYVNVIECRFRVPSLDLCGTAIIQDTSISTSPKSWYTTHLSDSILPFNQFIYGHAKSICVDTTDTFKYANYLIRTYRIVNQPFYNHHVTFERCKDYDKR